MDNRQPLQTPDPVPLVLDVDGTLLRSDMLYETFWAALGRDSGATLRTVLTRWTAPNLLKRDLQAIAAPNVELLPVRPAILDLARSAIVAGRAVHLASGSDRGLVEALARRLDLPGEHFASDETRNLTDHVKAQVLYDRFGPEGFDYVGNSLEDLATWKQARRIIAVSPDPGLKARIDRLGKPAEVIHDRAGPSALLREMRPQQWVKNLLLFLPLLAAHDFRLEALWAVLLAVVAFSIGASSIYILNDLLDLDADRRHPDKRNRPIASGALPIRSAMIASLGLAALALLLAGFSGPGVAAMTFLYMTTSLVYSLWLKKRRWLDLVSLAFMFLLRVLTGAVAAQVAVSAWLLGFVFAVFLTLACVKRMTELARASRRGKLPGRGYSQGDFTALEWISGISSALSVALFVVYAYSDHAVARYGSPHLLALATIPVGLWLFRVVRLSERGKENYDPVEFVLHDRIGLAIAAVGLVMILIAA